MSRWMTPARGRKQTLYRLQTDPRDAPGVLATARLDHEDLAASRHHGRNRRRRRKRLVQGREGRSRAGFWSLAAVSHRPGQRAPRSGRALEFETRGRRPRRRVIRRKCAQAGQDPPRRAACNGMGMGSSQAKPVSSECTTWPTAARSASVSVSATWLAGSRSGFSFSLAGRGAGAARRRPGRVPGPG